MTCSAGRKLTNYFLVIFAGWLPCCDVATEAAVGLVGRSRLVSASFGPGFGPFPAFWRGVKPTGRGIRRRGGVLGAAAGGSVGRCRRAWAV